MHSGCFGNCTSIAINICLKVWVSTWHTQRGDVCWRPVILVEIPCSKNRGLGWQWETASAEISWIVWSQVWLCWSCRRNLKVMNKHCSGKWFADYGLLLWLRKSLRPYFRFRSPSKRELELHMWDIHVGLNFLFNRALSLNWVVRIVLLAKSSLHRTITGNPLVQSAAFSLMGTQSCEFLIWRCSKKRQRRHTCCAILYASI